MILGKVIGQVWGTKRSPNLGPEKLLLVSVQKDAARDDGYADTGSIVVALDNIGAKPGELVTVSWGSGARAVVDVPDNRDVLADAAITRIVDGTSFKE